MVANNKKQYEKISIALSPEILSKLEEGQYNKSKLINNLLTKFFATQNKKTQGEAPTEKN